MRKLFVVLGLVIIILFPYGARAQQKALVVKEKVELIKIGYRAEYDKDSKQSTKTDLFIIKIGDTSKAERFEQRMSRAFGPYALNATIWVREQGAWKKIIYITPQTIDEISDFAVMDWEERKKRFSKTTTGLNANYFPYPLVNLCGDDISKIDFIFDYKLGGITLHLKVGVSKKEGKKLVKDIVKIYTKKSNCARF